MDNNSNNIKKKKFSIKNLSKRKQIALYISFTIISLILVIVLSISLSKIINDKIALEKELEERKQIFQELTQEQINLQDSEYAIVYIDDTTIIIPNSKIIIEYTNK